MITISHLIHLQWWWFNHQVVSASCDLMVCSPSGSSVHGNFQARIPEHFAIAFSRGSFLTQRLNLGLLHCRQILYQLSYQGGLKRLKRQAKPQRKSITEINTSHLRMFSCAKNGDSLLPSGFKTNYTPESQKIPSSTNVLVFRLVIQTSLQTSNCLITIISKY